MDNWKLLSTESNYPEHDFPNILQCGVVLFVSSMCPCFRNILPCFCPHIQPLVACFLSALIALMLHRLWLIRSVVCVCAHCRWMTARLKPLQISSRQWCHRQQSSQLRSVMMMTKDNNGELSCAALPLVTRSASDIRHLFLPKMCSPALMGCSILIWLHKKKIWAFILFRKQHSSFTKALRVALQETGIQQLFPFLSWLMW